MVPDERVGRSPYCSRRCKERAKCDRYRKRYPKKIKQQRAADFRKNKAARLAYAQQYRAAHGRGAREEWNGIINDPAKHDQYRKYINLYRKKRRRQLMQEGFDQEMLKLERVINERLDHR